MKKISPVKIAELLIERFDVRKIQRLDDCIEEIIREVYPHLSMLQLAEKTEEIKEKVRRYIHKYIQIRELLNSPPKVRFSISDPDILIGYFYPSENSKYTLINEIQTMIAKISPNKFEELCGIILLLEGFHDIWLPKRDEGVDIFAKDKYNRLYICQVKRYPKDAKVPLNDLRALLGAKLNLELTLNLKFKALFFTSGCFSYEGLNFAKRNKIILYDGEKIAFLIIKRDIKYKRGRFYFDDLDFNKWVMSFNIQRYSISEIMSFLRDK